MTSASEAWDRELEDRALPSPLLQSWAWGEVQAQAGWRVERLRLPGGFMASVQRRGIGPLTEAYVPRGPVPASPQGIEALVAWARGQRLARLRVEPDAPAAFAAVLRDQGFGAAEPIQPAHTRMLPLGDPSAVLAAIDRGTRYNIRVAERKGVTIEEGADAGELARQSAAVETREGISLPGRTYYELLLGLLPWCRTYVARHPQTEQALCAVLTVRHSGRGYNLFAGRTGSQSELKANDLAHWRAISGCAEAGLREYDLWGVPPPDAGPDHPWHGLGQFKAGFGGARVDYAGAWELVLSRAASQAIELQEQARLGVRRLRRNIS